MKLSKATLSENGTPGKNWKMVQSGGGWLKSYRLIITLAIYFVFIKNSTNILH